MKSINPENLFLNTSIGLTETLGFNIIFSCPAKSFIKIKSIKVNPKNKKVYFVTLFDEDLKSLFDPCFKENIKEKHIKHNEFAVYRYAVSKK